MGQITTSQDPRVIKQVRHADKNMYDYVLEDLTSKLDDKTYRHSEKFIRL